MGAEALQHLLERHPLWRGAALAQAPEALATGFAALDAELPGGGWPVGALTELLAGAPGIGELGLVLPALARLTAAGRHVVCLAPPHAPYAPALAAAGVDLTRLLVVRASGRDALWAAEQALRSGGCAALAAWLARPRYSELQRLAVAAEAGRSAAWLYRPPQAASESSPACLRLALEPAQPGLAVRIVKRRGAPFTRALYLERPFHAVDRASIPGPAAGRARAARRLGLPVHA
jgi:cell division inhibitor SulA/protein ImuA